MNSRFSQKSNASSPISSRTSGEPISLDGSKKIDLRHLHWKKANFPIFLILFVTNVTVSRLEQYAKALSPMYSITVVDGSKTIDLSLEQLWKAHYEILFILERIITVSMSRRANWRVNVLLSIFVSFCSFGSLCSFCCLFDDGDNDNEYGNSFSYSEL